MQSTRLPSSYLHVVVLLEELHAPLHHRGQVEVHHFVCGPVTRRQHLQGKARETSNIDEKKGRDKRSCSDKVHLSQ